MSSLARKTDGEKKKTNKDGPTSRNTETEKPQRSGGRMRRESHVETVVR